MSHKLPLWSNFSREGADNADVEATDAFLPEGLNGKRARKRLKGVGDISVNDHRNLNAKVITICAKGDPKGKDLNRGLR